MAYNKTLAQRVRSRLADLTDVEEKAMMGGLSFMLNGKMCVGVIEDALVCRIHPALYDKALKKTGCRPMDFTGRPMRGWVFVDPAGMKNKQDFDSWVQLALDFNRQAKSYKKPKPGVKTKGKAAR